MTEDSAKKTAPYGESEKKIAPYGESEKKTAPYGAWPSPVTTELMTAGAVSLGALSAFGEEVAWLEGRPAEAGRQVLMLRRADGTIEEATPAPANVGSRVHEYGGGAYALGQGLIIYSERSDGSVQLIEDGAPARRLPTPDGCRYADFEFDPARRRVIAVREDHHGRPPSDPKAAIVALSLEGAPEEILVEGPDFLSSPRLSPDGTRLAWLEWSHPDMPWDATRLFCARLSGEGRVGEARLIAGGGAPEAIVQPAWSPDGVLHFSSDRTGWWNLYARRGEADEALCPVEAEIGGPHWVFRQRFYAFLPDGRIIVSVVRDGVRKVAIIANGALSPRDDFGQVLDCPAPVGAGAAYVAAPPHAPASIALKPTLDAPALVLRAAAPAILPPEAVSIGEPIAFATSHGPGRAFWYAPRNAGFEGPQGEKPPLVVLIHGGPTSMTTNNFSLNVQWWTSRGFGVVDVNYGGSTGFGRPFRRLLDGAWGLVDVEDCEAAARHLAALGLVDPARMAIRGGSAGGFTTLAALTSGSGVFKAGASLYGVADLTLLARDTHKFESRYLDRLIGPLSQSRALYDERSPISHLDRLACPVIFFQGEDDKTVPPNQAQTMADAMKARGLSVAFYLFSGEGHGFRKAQTLKRVLELELDFYGRAFGFEPPGLSERVVISGGA
ncbi:prolyl oligopeptidase family serine peptidase [Methylocella sp.]|uniref:S9 family peptidase n=1 Tax=Methylocella sp. TaxID=1978226 RepID=UPI0035B26843